MNARSNVIRALLLVVACSLLCSAAASAASLDELKARFKARLPKLLEMKKAGKVGETYQGLLGAVDAKYLKDAAVKKMIDDENADRKALFQIMAQQLKTKPEIVGQREFKRRLEKAKPEEYFKTSKDAPWKQKKNIK